MSSNPTQPTIRTPTSNPAAIEKDRRRSWSTIDLESVLNGSVDPKIAKEADRKGLLMSTYGAMQAAVSTTALLPLLDLLEPPAEGESKIDLVIDLLEKMLESQVRIEAKLAVLDSRTAKSRQLSQP